MRATQFCRHRYLKGSVGRGGAPEWRDVAGGERRGGCGRSCPDCQRSVGLCTGDVNKHPGTRATLEWPDDADCNDD
jgi:hypothetical protein